MVRVVFGAANVNGPLLPVPIVIGPTTTGVAPGPAWTVRFAVVDGPLLSKAN
jgi:hypothetical protein